MSKSSASAVRLLAELLELEQQARRRLGSLTVIQKQRRVALSDELRQWALAQQRAPGGGAEKRQSPRAEVRLRVQLIGGPRPVDVETSSISEGGLSLTLRAAPRLGDRIALRLVPPPPDESVEVTTEVAWYDPKNGGAGLKFCDLGEEARALIARLVYAHLLAAKEKQA
jgi:hypothetical protein